MPRRLGLLLLVCSFALAACGSDDGTPQTSPKPALSGSLTVFAAASLSDAFSDVQEGLAVGSPDLDLKLASAGSQALVAQIQQGAPADVFASADERTMQRLVDAELVETPQVFARNTLEIVVAPGNPERIEGLRDLARPELVVVLADPSVPAGAYSAEVLREAAVTVAAKSLELDVKATLAKVASGEADAAIVYRSDVLAAGDRATGVEIPAQQNVIADYPIAVVKGSAHAAAARAFVEEILSGAAQDVLRRRGFVPAG